MKMTGSTALAAEMAALDKRIKQYEERLSEQLDTIKALNDCIGGAGSLTTDNLVLVSRLEHRIEELERELDHYKQRADILGDALEQASEDDRGQNMPDDVARLFCNMLDNLGDMPISDAWADKVAREGHRLLEKYNYFRK